MLVAGCTWNLLKEHKWLFSEREVPFGNLSTSKASSSLDNFSHLEALTDAENFSPKEDELWDLWVLAVMVSVCYFNNALFSLCRHQCKQMSAVNGSSVLKLSEALNCFLEY